MMFAEHRFVVDESAFAFRYEDAASVDETMYRFLSLLDYALGTGGGVLRWSEIWQVESTSGRQLHEVLMDQSLDRDLRLLLLGRVDKLQCWDDVLEAYPPLSAYWAGGQVDMAPSVGLCLLTADGGHHMAALATNQAAWRGRVDVCNSASGPGSPVFFLIDPPDAKAWWRALVEMEDFSAAELEEVAPLAFPTLDFVIETTWRQLRQFEGAYRDIRGQLIRHLSGLDDHAVGVWSSNVEPTRIVADMASRCGINCSPDSPQTHKNKKAMAERTVTLGESVIACEWHTKLEPHRNRIHFSVDSGRVVVGIFTDHLTT